MGMGNTYTYSDTVPVLVNHHDTEKHAQREEEEAVDVVLYSVADGSGECKQKNLGNGEKCSAKNNVTNGPAIIEGAEDENELRDDVDDDADNGPEDVDHPKPDDVGVGEAGETLKGGDGDEERNAEYGKAREAENLYGVCIRFGLEIGMKRYVPRAREVCRLPRIGSRQNR
jgi:hypothetical protein